MIFFQMITYSKLSSLNLDFFLPGGRDILSCTVCVHVCVTVFKLLTNFYEQKKMQTKKKLYKKNFMMSKKVLKGLH